MEVDEATPHEVSAEVQSPKRKVTRVESEETQDYARETLAISQGQAEEMGFVQSAHGEPRGATYLASVVIEEGGEARTLFLRFSMFRPAR